MILIPTIEHTGTHFVVSLFGTEIDLSRRPGMQAFDSLRPDIQQELIKRLSHMKDTVPGGTDPMVPSSIRLDPDAPVLADQVVFEHIPKQLPMLLALAEVESIIIPLRHPKVTAVSWKSRGKDEAQMCDDFRTVVEQFDPLNPYYLPIDSERRQDFLDEINIAFDLELETDWTPIGEIEGNAHLRHGDVECSPLVAELCDEIKPFLDRFYANN